jgi:hypothetical protein
MPERELHNILGNLQPKDHHITKRKEKPKLRETKLTPYLNAIIAMGSVGFVAGFGLTGIETYPISQSFSRTNALKELISTKDGIPPTPQVLAKANEQLKVEHAVREAHIGPRWAYTGIMNIGLFGAVAAGISKSMLNDRLNDKPDNKAI